jgi:hypothetical protein
VSVNWTVSGALPDWTFEEKELAGGDRALVTLIYAGMVLVLLPAVFETPREIA